MTWVKLDDQFPDHPKIAKVGPLGGWLQVCGLAYCNRHLTDGFIPTEVAHRLANFSGIGVETGGVPGLVAVGYDPDCESVAESLCAVKMWKKVRGGYRIHDYEKYQPSREEVLAEREKTRQRVKNFRARNAVTNKVTNPRRNAVTNTVSNATPVPVLETPTPIEGVSRTGGSKERTDAALSPANGAAPLIDRLAALVHRDWDNYPSKVDLRLELMDRGLSEQQAVNLIEAETVSRLPEQETA